MRSIKLIIFKIGLKNVIKEFYFQSIIRYNCNVTPLHFYKHSPNHS